MSDETNPQQPKHILQSKVLWANLLGPAIVWAGARYGFQVDASTQELIVSIVMAVGNIILRFFTTQPVTVLSVAKPA